MRLENSYEYSQPDFYRFSEDSILLAKEASKRDFKSHAEIKVLDLCAGSGVVGIETIKRLRAQGVQAPISLTINEIQNSFFKSINENLKLLDNQNVDCKIVMGDLFCLDWDDNQFDLILCNPPYFKQGEGLPSKDIKRDLCRRWEHNHLDLISLIRSHLTDSGTGFLIYQSSDKEQVSGEIIYERKVDRNQKLVIIRIVR